MAIDPSSMTLTGLAGELGLSVSQVTRWSHYAQRSSAYAEFSISKRSGGTRSISAPTSGLRAVQRRLLALLSSWYRPRACVHGFTANRSIVSNASVHRDRAVLLNVDLEEFFSSINLGRVRGALMSKPFLVNASVATVIARLACRDNKLPQGAPTSPVLANIVCMRLDGELQRLAKGFGCRYTRYADDLTFSTNKKVIAPELGVPLNAPYGTQAVAGPSLSAVIASNGFIVNAKKVRLCGRSTSQRVTGLTVNKFPNVHRKYVRQLRAMIHAWEKFGLAAAEAEFQSKYVKPNRAPFRGLPSFERVVHGKLMFLGMVRGFSDSLYVSYAKKCRALSPTLFAAVLDRDDSLARNVWVLECEESGNQGTGFFLQDVGLVTCAHVLGPKTVAFHPTALSSVYPVTVVARDDHLDIAVLKLGLRVKAPLRLGDPKRIQQHSRILVAGYPSYGFGDGLYSAWGTVTAERTRHAVKYFVPSFAIAAGNSGGPVIDENYNVIGIAGRGIASLAQSGHASHDSYGVISIAHLTQVLQVGES